MADAEMLPGATVHRVDDHGNATLTLDAPGNRNALSAVLIAQLTEHLVACAGDPRVRMITLTHTGNTFSSGADLAETAREGGPAAGTLRLAGLLRAIVALPKPVVARIDGNVRAGGIGLMCACDLTVATPTSSFAFTEVRLGLAPAIISLTVLPAMTHQGAAATFLTGDQFDAHQAQEFGLITAVADDPDATVAGWHASFGLASPQGLAATKTLLRAPVLAAIDADADALVARSAALFSSEEAQAGIAALRARRPAPWVL